MYVNGAWVPASDGGARELVNPSNEEVIARVAEGTQEGRADGDRGGARGVRRRPVARHSGAGPRDAAVQACGYYRRARARALADGDAQQRQAAARDRIRRRPTRRTASAITAGSRPNRTAKRSTSRAPSQTITVREPIGVCGQIIPWNYPLLMAAWKLAPALAAGNTCVLKPSELTPLTVLRLATFIDELEFPEGVVNIVFGSGPIVGRGDSRKVRTSTRSRSPAAPTTGRSIMQAATGNLEENFARAGRQIAQHRVRRRGFRHRGRLRAVRDLRQRRSGLLGGFAADRRGFDPRQVRRTPGRACAPRSPSAMGSIRRPRWARSFSRAHTEKVESYIKTGIQEGAKLETGGKRPPGELGRKGNFVEPTIFTNTTPDMRIVREEIFGPVLVVQRFKDEADAVKLANDTVYGLAGAVFTNDIAKAHRVIRSCAPASRGSTHIIPPIMKRHGAATNSPASAASSARTATTNTPRSSRSTSISRLNPAAGSPTKTSKRWRRSPA